MAGELIPISDEQAKAVQEIVKAFRGLGAFIEKALGSTPERTLSATSSGTGWRSAAPRMPCE
jgi:hypothetical protein